MQVIHTLKELESWLADNPRPAFVPTMGALHDAHLSLVRAAKETKRPVLVSVFVNPTQFGPNEDFAAYPRDEAGDAAKLESAGADAVFLPQAEDIYPNGKMHPVPALPMIFSELEGKIRPGHFAGVAQVLYRFFSLIQPSSAFFGQKDYQQTMLVKWLIVACGFETQVIICPIIREANGLAMSSRNAYLTDTEREQATGLHHALLKGKRLFEVGERDTANIIHAVEIEIRNSEVFTAIDYVDIRDPESFQKISWIINPVVMVVVARIGKTRLLDNVIIG